MSIHHRAIHWRDLAVFIAESFAASNYAMHEPLAVRTDLIDSWRWTVCGVAGRADDLAIHDSTRAFVS